MLYNRGSVYSILFENIVNVLIKLSNSFESLYTVIPLLFQILAGMSFHIGKGDGYQTKSISNESDRTLRFHLSKPIWAVCYRANIESES